MNERVRVERLHDDMFLFVGTELESVCTAIRAGRDVILIDGLASVADATALRRILEQQMKLHVRFIVPTHYDTDHIAALRAFPDATVIAQRFARCVFLSRMPDDEGTAAFVEPQLVFDDALSLRWGEHVLHFRHNPGKTLDMIHVDAPTLDTVFVGDQLVGNIVYLSKADPALVETALLRVQRLGRARVIGGHVGYFDGGVTERALHYLSALRTHVVRIRRELPLIATRDAITNIPLAGCLAAGVDAGPFEREWHQRNLEAIYTQGIFTLDARTTGNPQPHSDAWRQDA